MQWPIPHDVAIYIGIALGCLISIGMLLFLIVLRLDSIGRKMDERHKIN